MKRILFCVLTFLSIAGCGSGKASGILPGLTTDQAQQFSDLQAAWSDAKSAYQTAYQVKSAPVNRSGAMKNVLQQSGCVPGVQGVPNQGINQTWNFSRTLNGSACPVTAMDTQTFSRFENTATFAATFNYQVPNNTHGTDFLKINPLSHFYLTANPPITVTKSGPGTITSGHFGLDIGYGNSRVTGDISISDTGVGITMSFPNFTLSGAAQWQAWGPTPSVTYYIQNTSVTEAVFHSAFDGFAIDQFINMAQQIPKSM